MAERKLTKKIEGTTVILSLKDVEGDLIFDTATLPQEMQNHLIPFGAGHKLGDAAAGAKTQEDAQKAIQRVWDGMVSGDWSTRVPAAEGDKAPKISTKSIMANLEKLPPEQQEAAKALLAAMGFSLPEPKVEEAPAA